MPPAVLASLLPHARRAGRALALGLVLAVATPHAADRLRMQQAAERLGPRAQAALPALLSAMQQAAGQDDEAQLDTINGFFNRRIVFADDGAVWGRDDHWASPMELLDQGRGDCEDYAIAKYFTLVALGVPVAKLRLVYVRAQIGGVSQAHMVLAYYASAGAEPLILDNLITSVRPASRRPDLAPVFSFNGEGLWQGAGAQSAGDPLARLSPWREVIAKARAEGFF
ncbi:MAG TPA: transglutaminase-like cysteine peptidase [Burkholderiaceae bacterium]|nr:transglutaminase-like cysteine peptidase [Burkholderiaceae bacterium]